MLVEKKVCLIAEASNRGRADLCPKANSPADNQGARAFKGECQGCIGGGRGLRAEAAQSALTVVLKLVTLWSDQRHLDCFEYS